MNETQQRELNERLLDAAIQGNVELIEELIVAGAEVNAVDDGEGLFLRFAALIGEVIEPSETNIDMVRQLGLTALHYAALGGKIEVLELLIGKGTNVIDQHGDVLLCLAAGNGKIEVLELLLAKGASIGAVDQYGNTLLHLAAANGKKEMTEHLIKNKKVKNINAENTQGMTALHVAFAGNHRELAESLLENGANVNVLDQYGNTLLHYAAENCQREMVELLTEKGLSVSTVNQLGLTPLHGAAYKGQKEVVEFLLENGADINGADQKVDTPLHYAARNDQKDVMKLLLQKGADMNKANQTGRTPFHLTVANSDKEMVEVLLEKGANINAVDHDGNISLHLAAYNDQKEVVESLLENGADISAVNRQGMTPLHIAVTTNHREVVESLLENGANINTVSHNGSTVLEISMAVGNNIDTSELIVSHIAKLEAAGLYVSKINLQLKNVFINTSLERYNDYSQQLQNCEEGIKKLKRESKPLYDFLKGSNVNELASIWEKNADVRNKFDNQEDLKKQYPEYAHILISKANEVKKEIFLHNHKPLIDALSTRYECDIKTMTFAGVKNFFRMHKNDFGRDLESGGVTLTNIVELEDTTTRHIPTLKVKTFVEGIRSNALGTNLESSNAEQIQGVGQAPNIH